MQKSFRPLSFASVLLSISWIILLMACPSEDGGVDGGSAAYFCETRADEAEVLLGKTSLAYLAFADNDLLRTWERPQGGLGTRFNIAMRNVAVNEDFDGVRVLITRRIENQNAAEGEEGGSCASVPDGGFAVADGGTPALNGDGCNNVLRCVDEICALVLTDQRSRGFPKECIENQLMVAPEWSIRFFASTGLTLEQYDQMPVNIDVSVEADAFGEIKTRQKLILEVGEFLPPSWWDQ